MYSEWKVDNEISDIKRSQLEQRQRERDERSPSILDTFEGIELTDEREALANRLQDADVTLDDKPDRCPTCNGTGYTKSLFSKWECCSCFGTGYDLSDPVAVIKWQKLCLDWSKNRLWEYRVALIKATTTEEERLASEVESFYENARRKD
ncbi:hypothetical protein MZJ31_004448 [Vibrio parahaemolyticus]|uniref:hypothetical protein n=1 Tax=Vibrio parahaemolyticus TaxID=670 RepID=UPI00114CB4DC|nr:hypothetical protein [Vibrio parahaemolyticus]EGQ9864776.1 hypothetical protein [Vibrio parahaemolyticus]EIA9327031.1 hypothetical protein [Vibrio parahaemolyticus]EJC7104795.1 hypothetical protein [Vibrio parahaemolyticus]EJC7109327.1 hypothetical protein [Vibrio parahaemolyticus]EJG0226353.1 hypothetical protein [Vibrio parahaemolyticus]